MTLSRIALAAALALGGTGVVTASPAEAQQKARSEGAQLKLGKRESEAIRPLQEAIAAQDWAAAQAALPAAEAAAEGRDAKYFVGRAKLVIGSQTQNPALQKQALETLIALPNVPADELPVYLERQAELAFSENDFAAAERAFSRLLELNPNDPRILNNLAVVRSRMGDTGGVLQALQQQVEAAEAAGQRAEEDAYRRLLSAALQANQAELANRATARLLTAYPNPENWRTALVLLRQRGQLDEQGDLDTYRLQRATGALAGEQDYFVFAQQLNRAGMPGEAKAVLDEGIARNQLSMGSQPVQQLSQAIAGRIAEDRASLERQQREAAAAGNGRLARSVGDALYGYGRYGEAAELYRTAMQKGGVDPNLLNLRLGAALALAGQRSEAEAALRAVSGPREQLANLWLLWLDSKQA